MNVDIQRLLGRMICAGLWSALIGYACGILGANCLSKDYEGYSPNEAGRAGALGNFILGASISGVKSCFFKPVSANQNANNPTPTPTPQNGDNNATCENIIGEAAINTFSAVAGGALGYAMLVTVTEMPLSKIMAAIATGSGVMLAIQATLICLVAACLCCLSVRSSEQSNAPDLEAPNEAPATAFRAIRTV